MRYFVQKFSRRLNKSVAYVPAEAMEALAGYSWPGNIRELENFIERAVLLSPGKELRVTISELKPVPAATGAGDDSTSSLSAVPPSTVTASPGASISTLEDARNGTFWRALRQTEWRIAGPTGAAVELGMKRTTLQARMRKLGIRRPVCILQRRNPEEIEN